MTRTRVYLDYNATAPLRPEAARAMTALFDAAAGAGTNPSSVHADGRAARKRLEDARAGVAALVGAKPADLVFVSGATEANNWVVARAPVDGLAVSAIEHDSVLAPARARAAADGLPLVEIAPDADGVVTPAAVAAALDELAGRGAHRPLVSVMLANNEVGTIQPVAEIAAQARARGALVHTDAVQAAGKCPVDMAALGVDALSLSAHKIGGPPGVGALALRAGLALDPLIAGGGQERRYRSGTENLPGIVGFAAAAEAAAAGLDAMAGLGALRDRLEAAVVETAPEAVVFGQGAARLANTSAFAVPGLKAETLMMHMDLAGVSVGSGSACSSGKVSPSHVLAAMGADADLCAGAVRISLGWATTDADVDRAAAAWRALYRRLAGSSAPRAGHTAGEVA
ncbi:hypothetical protein CCR85_08970 [Rhodothalassium salexigens]|uniref:cysteine desulfurase family protein n=1 Tax=Rhodothalassium salexigens TaxID=1086 RepID=UPI0019115C28|nr:cysteine desulfurase family protein [Rhodothalassium salexigens]MBK5911619.1 hypothetical protein [Rhodothalassium salexigens]MBK5920912.1 hypothetical protein [Rhodothalassium salexigens]